jgi:hypothetical protein
LCFPHLENQKENPICVEDFKAFYVLIVDQKKKEKKFDHVVSRLVVRWVQGTQIFTNGLNLFLLPPPPFFLSLSFFLT